ncbi:hypothetical protein JXD38_08490 [candidate division WOR-3 bacterium]|nr:hypothetical protein [candidate division WOR-3 bacterium]
MNDGNPEAPITVVPVIPDIGLFVQALDDHLGAEVGSGVRRWQTMTCRDLYAVYEHNCFRMKEAWRGNANRDFTAFLAEILVLRLLLVQLRGIGDFKLDERTMPGSEQRRFVATGSRFEIRANYRVYYDGSNGRRYREPDIAVWSIPATTGVARLIGLVEVKANNGDYGAIEKNLAPLRNRPDECPIVVIAFGCVTGTPGCNISGAGLHGNPDKLGDKLRPILDVVDKLA